MMIITANIPVLVSVSAFLAMVLLSLLGKYLVPEDSADYTRTRSKFLMAGLRKANVVAIFWGIKLLLTFFFPVCFFLAGITLLKPISANTNLSICLLLAFSGFYLPDIWLFVRTSRRKDKILKGLPDALDLLVVCVETGMGLDAAINRIAEEIKLSHKILSDEFRLLNLEIRAGKSAQALRVYSDSVRTKRYQKAEEIAAKLPVKLMLPLILLIFPSLFVVILGPALIRVYHMFLQ
jgi:tight adherence protein C